MDAVTLHSTPLVEGSSNAISRIRECHVRGPSRGPCRRDRLIWVPFPSNHRRISSLGGDQEPSSTWRVGS